jgi:hypothetical protein
METQSRLRWSLLGLPIAGLASALVALRASLGVLERVNVLGSLTFGIFLSAWFWAFLGFRSIGKTLAFIILSPIAAVLAVWTAVFFDGRFGISDPNDLRLYFIGGYTGAFFLLVAVSLLVSGNVKLLRAILLGLGCGVFGGLLAVVGRIAGTAFRGYWMQINPGQPEPDTSLIFMWHIGMALVLGLALWLEENLPTDPA